MAPATPDRQRIQAFASEAAFENWLKAHHDKQPELWLKIHKKGSGLPSVMAAFVEMLKSGETPNPTGPRAKARQP